MVVVIAETLMGRMGIFGGSLEPFLVTLDAWFELCLARGVTSTQSSRVDSGLAW